jgi:hypothetical protein
LLQAKLEIGSPHDPAEQEADRAADAVMNETAEKACTCGPAGGGDCEKCRNKGVTVARSPSGAATATGPAPPIVHAVLAGSGQPLASGTRSLMERRFGQDFGGVRVHMHSQAAESAHAIGARAYTVGRDVIFGAGQYAPDTSTGRRLLAHELAHVVQQAGSPPVLRRQPAAPAATPAPPDAAIDRAVKSGNALDITAIQDFSAVKEADRLRFIRILNGETSGAISGGHVIKIWRSFPDDRFGPVMTENRPDWDRTVQRFGGDPLTVLPPKLVAKLKQEFETAVKGVATGNLKQNEQFVDAHMQKMGLKAGEEKPHAAAELQTLRRTMQALAWDVWSLRQSQKKLEGTPIGYRPKKLRSISFISILMGGEDEQVFFDPRQRPDGPPPLVQAWGVLKEEWDRAGKGIAEAAGSHPEIYEAIAEEDDEKLLELSRLAPEAYAARQKTLLQTLLDRIVKIGQMIDGGELDLLAFRPIHDRLTTGEGRWAVGFDKYVAGVLVAQHEKDEEQRKKLIHLSTAAAAMLAPFVSTGIGAVLEAVAIAVAVTAAAVDYAQASRQAEAARATPVTGTNLIDRTTADEAKAKATAQMVETAVMAIISAVALGAAGGKALYEVFQMARLRAVIKDEALLAKLLGRVSDKSQLYRLAARSGDATKLEALLKVMPDAARLEKLLELAGDATRLTALLEKVPDIRRLGLLLEGAGDGARLEIMLARLGKVEEVEAMLARQLRGEAAGLKDVASMRRVAEAADAMKARWDQLTPEQRLEAALKEVNAELEVQGVPAISARPQESATSVGAFRDAKWEAEIDPGLLKSTAEGGDPGKLATALMHEGRHAEQSFLAARLKASKGMSTEVMAYPRSEGGLSLPPRIAERAAARKLPPDSPQGKFAAEMARSMETTLGTPYNRIIGRRNDAMIARDEAQYALWDARRKVTIKTGEADPWTPEIKAAKEKLRDAERAFEIADKAYRGIPFEKDAFAVEAEFEKLLKAAGPSH